VVIAIGPADSGLASGSDVAEEMVSGRTAFCIGWLCFALWFQLLISL
jgi:hypothetical protein